jgi:DNA primase
LSPFQKEKTASFMVSPQKQIFKDFSSGIGGNAITFIMEYEKVDFWDAIKILSHDFSIDITDYKFNNEKQQKVADQKEKYRLLNKYAQNFFKDSLLKSDIAKEYLFKERKLSEEIIEKFNI